MHKPVVTVQLADIETIMQLSASIPEFDAPYPAAEFHRRLSATPHLILVAYADAQPAGFKVGYARSSTVFYSWMGGVLPAFRRLGVAATLADAQEDWARQNGFATIELKTRNRYKAMLCFALNRGFDITGIEIKDSILEMRIFLQKSY
ncbi:MAG: GNAT family N-acetyltransferase [Saprospiraceae bacterium]|nr:GNAT family N-acetyltransferase [Saprospiraceae bacterium]